MTLPLFFKGLVLGFSIAAPVGPIGVLCIRRTLAGGRMLGLATGLGVATADALYGLMAGLGLTFISTFLVSGQIYLRIIGGIFLAYLGIKTMLTKPARESADRRAQSLLGAYLSILFFTLTNPMTIMTFTAMFAGLGLVGSAAGYLTASTLVAGIFLGSASWWLILSSAVAKLRERLNHDRLLWVNRLSGATIIAFAIAVIFSLKK